MSGDPGFVRSAGSEARRRSNEIALIQTTELWSNYGKLFEIRFDGGVLPPEQGGPDLLGLSQRLQPDAIVIQRPPRSPDHVRKYAGQRRSCSHTERQTRMA
ncbi:MAG: hypothetical protein P4L33_00210 [Capsulimonadaceae bacterium]|nr:hypothetical protein [Capsulimonadaceae bacterium]